MFVERFLYTMTPFHLFMLRFFVCSIVYYDLTAIGLCDLLPKILLKKVLAFNIIFLFVFIRT